MSRSTSSDVLNKRLLDETLRHVQPASLSSATTHSLFGVVLQFSASRLMYSPATVSVYVEATASFVLFLFLFSIWSISFMSWSNQRWSFGKCMYLFCRLLRNLVLQSTRRNRRCCTIYNRVIIVWRLCQNIDRDLQLYVGNDGEEQNIVVTSGVIGRDRRERERRWCARKNEEK